MKKNQKGITMVSLVVTVILLLIVAGVSVNIGTRVITQAKLQTVNTNMMLIQAKVKTLAEQAKFDSDTSGYVGTVVTSVSDNQKVLKLVNDGVIDDTANYYVLSSTDLQTLGLQKVDIDDGYVVNYETEEIIYVRGFTYNGTTYYKLSDLKNTNIE